MSNNLFIPAVKNLRHFCYFRLFCCQVEPNGFLNRHNLFQKLFKFFFTRIFECLMGKRSIEPYVHAQAVALYQSGLNLSKISKQLQVSRCCVPNAITKFEEYTKFDDMKRSCRLKSLSNRNIRELKTLVQGDNRLTAAKITTDLNMSLFKSVSKCTVRRYLKKLGYEYAVKIKIQWLSTKHRKAHVRWCERCQHWILQDWRKVIFSDGSTFYVLKRKKKSENLKNRR